MKEYPSPPKTIGIMHKCRKCKRSVRTTVTYERKSVDSFDNRKDAEAARRELVRDGCYHVSEVWTCGMPKSTAANCRASD